MDEEEVPVIEICSYCGSDDIHIFHTTEPQPKGIKDIVDVRCRGCGALLWGSSRLIKS